MQVVATQWLWCCAERWEHVSEKLFPLKDAAPEEPLSGRRRNRLGRPLGPILSPEERQQVRRFVMNSLHNILLMSLSL